MCSLLLPTDILCQFCSLYICTTMLTGLMEMQQLRCVLLVYWISDADSQGCTDLQSLVNLNCLHCGESDTISNCANLHQAVRCNEVHCIVSGALYCSSGLTFLGHACFSVWFVVGTCKHAAHYTYVVAFDHIMLTSYRQAHEPRLAIKLLQCSLTMTVQRQSVALLFTPPRLVYTWEFPQRSAQGEW